MAGAIGGPVGAAAALLAHPFMSSTLNDPSFVRFLAGRRLTAETLPALLAQYAQRAGLSQTTPVVNPLNAGQSALAAFPTWQQAVTPVVNLFHPQGLPNAAR
jgi:hypothetical protein